MKPYGDIFELIKALTKTEKRYFKLFGTVVGGKDDSIYLKLFDAIEKMDFYDEASLKKRFKKELHVNQFGVLKNYLQNAIINSLVQCNYENFPASKLHYDLAVIEILFEKGLHHLCSRYISKCKAAAYLQQDYGIIDKVCDWECRLALCNLDDETARNAINEQIEVTEKRLADLRMKKNAFEIFQTSLQNDAVFQVNKYDYLLDESSTLTKQDNSILVNYYLHSALSIYYSILKNSTKRIENIKLALFHLEENPHFIEANFRMYIALMNNCINALHENNDIVLLQELVNKTKTVIDSLKSSLHNASKINGQLILLKTELLLFINKKSNKFPEKANIEAKDLIKNADSFIDQFNLFELYRLIVHANFIKKDFSNAIYFINEILKNNKVKNRPDIYYSARIWELIIHYEMKNFMFLETFLDSTYRFLKRNNKLFSFDRELILFLKAENINKKQMHLNYMLNFIQNIDDEKSMYSLLQDNFNFEDWLKEKL